MSNARAATAPDHQHLFSNNRKTRRPNSRFKVLFQRAAFAVLLAVVMTALVVYSLQWLPNIWAAIIRFWLPRLNMNADLLFGTHGIHADWVIRQIAIHVPAEPPTLNAWIAHGFATVMLFAASIAMTRKLLPIAHLLRIFCVVHALGLLVFAIRGGPATSAAAHTLALYNFSLALMLLTPTLLATSFYLFEGSLRRRVIGSLLIFAYLAIALPFKLIAHAWLIQLLTPLSMSTLYLLFGPALDVLLLVSLYAYVMAWDRNSLRWPQAAPSPTTP